MVSHRTLFYVNPFPARYCKCYCSFFGLDERSPSHQTPILSSLLQFSSRWYLCAQKSPYALHPVSQKFPHRCLSNSSSVRLTMAFSQPFKKGHLALPLSMPLSSRQSVVWCPWPCACRLCLKLLNTRDLPRNKPLVRVALPASLICSVTSVFKFELFYMSACKKSRTSSMTSYGIV